MRSSGPTNQADTTITPEHWTWQGANLDSARRLNFPADHPSVWQATLTDNSTILAHLTSLLSAEERVRLARFKLRADQQRFLIGRGLLRIFVGAYMNVPAERVEFNHGLFGKPCVAAHAGIPALQFNLSHSGGIVLLAFHPLHEVGVDVEEVRPDPGWKEIARHMFPAQEYRRLARLNPQAGLTAFFQVWTRHEARLKALGRGFGEQPEAVPDSRLSLFDLTLPEGYHGAVAF